MRVFCSYWWWAQRDLKATAAFSPASVDAKTPAFPGRATAPVRLRTPRSAIVRGKLGATVALLFLVACGGHEDAAPVADCSAARCELHSVETHRVLPDPPFVMSCSVPCGCDYDTLCAAEPFHGICGL
jgi:hypothetical protein